jgi:hypothetical protein
MFTWAVLDPPDRTVTASDDRFESRSARYLITNGARANRASPLPCEDQLIVWDRVSGDNAFAYAEQRERGRALLAPDPAQRVRQNAQVDQAMVSDSKNVCLPGRMSWVRITRVIYVAPTTKS